MSSLEIILNKIWFSTWESVITVILSLLIGGGLSWAEYFLKVKKSKIFSSLMILPVFLPGLIVALGFIIIWGNSGAVNLFLEFFGINKIKFLYSALAIIAGNCFYNIPLVYIALSSKLANMHYYLEDQAKVLGASHFYVLLKITWPRIRQTVIGISIIIFLYSFLSFTLPLILGGVKYQTLEVYIYHLITQQLNFKGALMIASLQFLGLLFLIIIFSKYLKGEAEKYFNIIQDKNNKNNFLIWIWRIVIVLFILLPIGGVVYQGFGYIFYLFKTEFFIGLARSLGLGFITSITSIILALILVISKKDFGKWSLIFLAISPVTLGIFLLFIFGKSIFILIMAYVFLIFPLNYFFISSFWKSRPLFFIETMKLLGADVIDQTKLIISYLYPTILKSLAISIVFVIGDIATVSLLSPYKFKTAMSLSYSYLGSYRFIIASASLTIILITISFVALLIYLAIYLYENRRKEY